MTKTCGKCKTEQPIDNFHWANKLLGTRKTECKPCRSKAWALQYPNTSRHWTDEYRRERYLLRRRAWYKKHSLKDPEKLRNYVIKRRAMLVNADGNYTTKQWIAKLDYCGYRCYYCSKELTIKTATKDHKIALAKGGSNWIANIVPACLSCNSGKCDRDFRDYLKYKNPEYAK